MLWFNFILGSNFIFLCFKLIIIHYNTQKRKKIKFEPRIKFNYNIYARCLVSSILSTLSELFFWSEGASLCSICNCYSSPARRCLFFPFSFVTFVSFQDVKVKTVSLWTYINTRVSNLSFLSFRQSTSQVRQTEPQVYTRWISSPQSNILWNTIQLFVCLFFLISPALSSH